MSSIRAQSEVVLKYFQHASRLTNISTLVRFLMGAIGRMEKSLPSEPGFIRARDQVIDAYGTVLASLMDSPKLDVEKLSTEISKAFVPAESSRSLVYSLCLVMLVTQVEIFIEHLIDTILASDPRRLKHIAGDKELKANELVDAQDYDSAMQRLRRKVAKEAIASKPRELFEKHLGQKFKLYRIEQLTFKREKPTAGNYHWGLPEIVAVWENRHRIVHEGELDVDEETFQSAYSGLLWLETFLSFRAKAEYDLEIDKTVTLEQFAKLFHISKSSVMGKFVDSILPEQV